MLEFLLSDINIQGIIQYNLLFFFFNIIVARHTDTHKTTFSAGTYLV